MLSEYKTFVTSDNAKIAGRYFEPGSDIVGTVVIAPAMGVDQDYYAPLAEWLSQQSFRVVTFDYRGMGRSRTGSLRGFKADLFDWAKDCSAVLSNLSGLSDNGPVYWLGHSLGGQIVPFIENFDLVTKVITVASGSGYWRENVRPLRRRVWWLWFVVVPLVLPLWGYFPGKRLRKVGDLPRDVMTQWRRWCLNQEYCVGAEGAKARRQFAAVRIPITSLSFADDEMMSRTNIESLHGFFANAPLTMKRIEPAEVGVRRIGHFGFFKKKFQYSLWQQHLLLELV